ncbi:MAG: nitrogen regulation protein NR(II) [Acidiferrobacterales bacterium]|nr:nitrogen regulation protein NR(II) [Acidiferrobacterales bacterium]
MNVDSNSFSELFDSTGKARQTPGIVHNLGTAIVVCNEQLNVVLLNPSAQSLLDVSENQALGQSIVTHFGHEDTEQIMQRCLHERRSTTLRHIELINANHRIRRVDCILTPTFSNGSPHLILEFNEVNTVVGQLLESSATTGESANAAVLRSIAHEIKNPLGGLRGAAQLLQEELEGNSGLKDYTRIIIREADRLCSLVDDMSGPQIPLRRARVNIHKVLEHVCRLVLAEKSEGLDVVRDYDPSLPEISGDHEQLIQVFINIVRNAMEAFDNSGRLTVRTRVQPQATLGKKRYRNAARIEIEDDGPGIPANLLDQIFFPLISGKANGEGLGLAIVRQIITRHEGSVTVDSRPGRTCFTILLKFADQTGYPEQAVQYGETA